MRILTHTFYTMQAYSWTHNDDWISSSDLSTSGLEMITVQQSTLQKANDYILMTGSKLSIKVQKQFGLLQLEEKILRLEWSKECSFLAAQKSNG